MLATGLETTKNIHHGWAWVVIIGNGLAGLWALAAHKWPALRGRPLWWFIGAVETAVFLQVLLGAYMVGHYKVPLPQFHAFYGFVAVIAVAVIYSYRIQMTHKLYLLYGFGSLFVMGLGIRAMLIAAKVK